MLIKSPIEQGRQYSTSPHAKSQETVQLVTIDLSKGVTAASDLLAVGKVPANCRPTSIEVIGGGLPATSTGTVGWLTGAALADDDDTRTLPGENTIQAGLVIDGTKSAAASTANCLKMAPVGYDRTIGIKLSANVPAGTAFLTLLMRYASLQ
jgi:hypothetical protein